MKNKIKKRLADSVYAYDDLSLPEAIGKILTRKKKTLSVAESCTGGLLAAQMTRFPGASEYFKGGMTVYSNEQKELLGIPKPLVTAKGAVSREVAVKLAEKMRDYAKTTYSLGVTGIAGPAGGSKRKPVGLVYIGMATPKGSKGWKHIFWGDRVQVQIKAARKALEYLWREIR